MGCAMPSINSPPKNYKMHKKANIYTLDKEKVSFPPAGQKVTDVELNQGIVNGNEEMCVTKCMTSKHMLMYKIYKF